MDLSDFEHLTPKQLREVAKQLQKMAYRKEGGSRELSKDRLSQLLDVESDNFMGTGLSLQEFLLCGKVDELANSFATQDKDERKRRLGFVVKLGAELDRMRSKGLQFGTALAEAAIESVILGDWKMVKDWANDFTFEHEHEQTRQTYAPLYAPFVGLLQEAFESRPKAEPSPKRTTH